MVRSLRRHQALTIDGKLVPFGLAAENRMIVEDQALQATVPALKLQGRSQSADAAADDDAVEKLARIGHSGRSFGEHLIADLMAGSHHFIAVAVRARIIAYTCIACPVIGGQQLAWTQRTEQSGAGAH